MGGASSGTRGGETREAIIASADDLFYRQGFAATGFADIAAAVGISRGNFYYHFRTKDEILEAVIARRLASTAQMLARWEVETDDPAERIRAFIHILITNGARIMDHGCPVGTLCNELAKLDHAARPSAARVFTLFREWLAHHFALLGHGAEADELALRVLSFTQGVATLATAFRDDAWVTREVECMCASLSEGPQKREGSQRCM